MAESTDHKETIKITGLTEGEVFHLLAEARANARIVHSYLRDMPSDVGDAVMAGNEIDADDLIAISLSATVKIDRLYAAMFDPEKFAEASQ